MNHQHTYHPGKKQIEGPNGTRYHPTVKDSWVSGLFCACGVECPPSEEDAVRAALKETARVRAMKWGGERGLQGMLWPEESA